MTHKSSRLEQWIKQGNVVIPQLFFTHYRALHISDQQAMVVLHIMSYQSAGIDFATPTEIASRMEITEHQVAAHLQTLMQKGFLKIEQQQYNEKVGEKYFLLPLYERLLDHVEQLDMNHENHNKKNEVGELFRMFEDEFGRIFTPLEYETISKWIDEDEHSPAVIRQALVEAVLAEKKSLKYIDRILFEWRKKNLKSIQDVKKHSENFHKYTIKPVAESKASSKVPFYNWLEERE